MEFDLATWFTAGRVVLIVAAFTSFGWALRRMRRESAAQLEQLLIAQQQVRAETLALSERLTTLATLVAALPARMERPAEPAPVRPRRETSGVRSYETARRLARSGATIAEIVATSGVAGSEARLLQRLHGGEPRLEDAS